MLRDLLSHADWADATVWSAVLGNRDVLYEPRVQFWLHHIHTVQHAFVRLWSGQALDFPEPSAFADAASLAKWGREGHAAIRQYHEAATPTDLASVLSIPWAERLVERFGRHPESVTVEESAYQVALHTAHHRGQVAARMRELGGDPPLIDYIAWLWLGRPVAPWPPTSIDQAPGPAL